MRFALPLLALVLTASAQVPNLISNPSFEAPVVEGRKAESEGGHPGRTGEVKTSWTHFMAKRSSKDQGEGQIVVGLTHDFAKTGKQALFIDFQKISAPSRTSFLMTDLLPVAAGHQYRVSIWGRTDRKRPLSLDQRRPLLRVEIEYFAADSEQQAGETDIRTQIMPGSLDRLLFTSVKWSEYFALVRAPQDAAFMKVTFRWETDRSEGTTDGLIFFDDAAIVEVPGGASLAPAPVTAPTTTPPAAGTPQTTPPGQ